jgi:hypothetical protein
MLATKDQLDPNQDLWNLSTPKDTSCGRAGSPALPSGRIVRYLGTTYGRTTTPPRCAVRVHIATRLDGALFSHRTTKRSSPLRISHPIPSFPPYQCSDPLYSTALFSVTALILASNSPCHTDLKSYRPVAVLRTCRIPSVLLRHVPPPRQPYRLLNLLL